MLFFGYLLCRFFSGQPSFFFLYQGLLFLLLLDNFVELADYELLLFPDELMIVFLIVRHEQLTFQFFGIRVNFGRQVLPQPDGLLQVNLMLLVQRRQVGSSLVNGGGLIDDFDRRGLFALLDGCCHFNACRSLRADGDHLLVGGESHGLLAGHVSRSPYIIVLRLL